MVPAQSRRPAFALDSMIVELSFMVGPAVAVVLATSLPTGAGLYSLAAGLVVSATLMCWLNPPTQPDGQEAPEVAPPRRSWFSARLVALMIAGAGATFVLSATEITVVASMKEAGVPQWTGLVIALWCAYSLMGGLVFGAVHSKVSAVTLVAAMALLTIPIGLASGWPWLVLALLPSGVLCAPSMTAANDNLAAIVPAASRGEAIGLLGSAFTAGVALGAPFAGAVIDAVGPQWAFAAAGVVGTLAILTAVPLYRRVPANAPLTRAAPVTEHTEAAPATDRAVPAQAVG
jgi:MFS family permease